MLADFRPDKHLSFLTVSHDTGGDMVRVDVCSTGEVSDKVDATAHLPS